MTAQYYTAFKFSLAKKPTASLARIPCGTGREVKLGSDGIRTEISQRPPLNVCSSVHGDRQPDRRDRVVRQRSKRTRRL